MGDDLDDVAMNKRLSTRKMDVANLVAREYVEREFGVLQTDRMLLILWQLVDGEVAERATRVADAGDCEMARARAAIDDRLKRSSPQRRFRTRRIADSHRRFARAKGLRCR
jgi:hypothetical protein